MEYAIRLNVNNTTDIIEIPVDHEYDWYAKQIGCEWIEVVHPKFSPYTLVVDEEGKLKTNHINIIASSMYGTFEHGESIVGDCLLVDEKYIDDGYGIVGFTYEKACDIKSKLDSKTQKALKKLNVKQGI